MSQQKSQCYRVIAVLERYGEISRNQSFRMYIARLASRIQDLEDIGYVFETKSETETMFTSLLASPCRSSSHYKTSMIDDN
jgi:hypothetical protein